MKTLRVGAVLAAVVAVASACGGGGSDSPASEFVLVRSDGALDGWVRSDGLVNPTTLPSVGDLDGSVPGRTVSAYYSFSLAALPPAAVILDAVLAVELIGATGDPYLEHGAMLAHYFPYGGALANVPGTAVPSPPTPAAFSPSDTSLSLKTATVTALLQRALGDGVAFFQVKVSFDGAFMLVNGVDDYVDLADGEDHAGPDTAPRVLISWRAP